MPTPIPGAATDLTRDLVRIDTRNPPGNEAPAVDLLARRLEVAGFDVAVRDYPVGPNRTQAVARLRGTGDAPGLLFSGHVDVVPPGETPWSVEVFGGEIRDGMLYGRGSCDMKSGVAALVTAAEAVAAATTTGGPLRGDLVVAITADEERNCLGAELLVEEPLFDGLGATIVAEPTGLRLFLAEKGALWIDVTITGRTAHGSMPHLGANAVSAMTTFLVAWEKRYAEMAASHPLLGTSTINVGVLHGGVKVNVVPDQCFASIDMRTVPPQDQCAIIDAARALLNEICAERGCMGAMEVHPPRPPVASDADTPLARSLGVAVQEIAGVDPTPAGVPYCTEMCIWTPQLGITGVICGPGDPGMAHQPDESVPVEQIEQAARIYTRVAGELLS